MERVPDMASKAKATGDGKRERKSKPGDVRFKSRVERAFKHATHGAAGLERALRVRDYSPTPKEIAAIQANFAQALDAMKASVATFGQPRAAPAKDESGFDWSVAPEEAAAPAGSRAERARA